MSDIDTDLLDRIASQFRWELFKLCSNTLSGDFPGREIEQLCRRYVGVALREQATEISRLRSLTTWRPMTEKPESGRRIVCLFDDGSGATLFIVHDHGFIDADGDEYDKLTSYEKWAYLPDGHELHCEGFDDFGLPPPPETKT